MKHEPITINLKQLYYYDFNWYSYVKLMRKLTKLRDIDVCSGTEDIHLSLVADKNLIDETLMILQAQSHDHLMQGFFAYMTVINRAYTGENATFEVCDNVDHVIDSCLEPVFRKDYVGDISKKSFEIERAVKKVKVDILAELKRVLTVGINAYGEVKS